MTEIDELLESIRLQEHQQLSFFERHFSSSSITKTSAIKKAISIDPQLSSKKLKTDKISKLLLVIILAGLWSVVIIDGFRNKTSNTTIAIFIIGALTAGLIYSFFINRKLNFTISLSTNGIAFNDEHFEWSQIKETAILHLPIGKHGTKFLVLLYTNDQFEKWELSNFTSFPHSFHIKLANYIEHFKPDATAIDNQTG